MVMPSSSTSVESTFLGYKVFKLLRVMNNYSQNSNMNFLDTTNKQTPTAGGNTDQTGHTGSNNRGFMDRVNNAVGGGQTGEQNEDLLDKGVDMFQQRVMGAGDQKNESALEQAKDEQISDAIRRGYKSTTGSEFPVKDKTN
ncbi:hypothetical protein CPB83DRAFT_863466 [Crepidotus variabilis]|uniref:Uncharacterized protein n=1 Tax=Crepidotus variabilis TaxID=179855 RepID=A0A9P6E5S5_9AGAR|nr:hypothetical protein CPB83DRAFT_863466 [Crepidotus variabilis]